MKLDKVVVVLSQSVIFLARHGPKKTMTEATMKMLCAYRPSTDNVQMLMKVVSQ